ncbi:DUF5132 domain-containing protein [Nodularia spumigena]|uniref:DUF5132 domain-containing protein n=1 Tax=Nodularia spumigena TaxID=70799 RepID=UPI000D31F73F|nr:DUF5132 domain-containing protein [Nodularia spumigena]
MTSTFDWQKVNVPEIVDSLTTIIFSPLIIPVAEAVKQPVIRNTIKEGMALSQRCQEVVNEAMERFENRAAEVNTQDYLTDGRSSVAEDFVNVMSDLNADVDRMTNGVVDLRLLVPLALSILAIRQLLKQGLKLEEIPWYILAWFAFDSFVKLNDKDEVKLVNLPKD